MKKTVVAMSLAVALLFPITTHGATVAIRADNRKTDFHNLGLKVTSAQTPCVVRMDQLRQDMSTLIDDVNNGMATSDLPTGNVYVDGRLAADSCATATRTIHHITLPASLRQSADLRHFLTESQAAMANWSAGAHDASLLSSDINNGDTSDAANQLNATATKLKSGDAHFSAATTFLRKAKAHYHL